MKTIGLSEAAEQVGVPYPTVARWIQQKLIRPRGYKSIQAKKVKLGPKEMRELRVLAHLRGLLSLQELRKAMRYLRNELKQNPLSTGDFLVLGGSHENRRLVKLCESGQTIELLSKKDKGQLWIPLVFGEDNGFNDNNKS